MKNKARYFAILASAMLSPLANADSQTLKVTGTIKPAACKISFVGGGTVTYNDISADSLTNKLGHKAIGTKNISLSIDCPVAAKTMFSVADNRSTSVIKRLADRSPQSASFGLGKADGKDIGVYEVSVMPGDSSIDGRAVSGLNSSLDKAVWIKPVGRLNTNVYYSLREGVDAHEPKASSTQIIGLRIDPLIDTAGGIKFDQDVVLDGEATFTLYQI